MSILMTEWDQWANTTDMWTEWVQPCSCYPDLQPYSLIFCNPKHTTHNSNDGSKKG